MSVIEGSPCDVVSGATESEVYQQTDHGASVKSCLNVTECALALGTICQFNFPAAVKGVRTKWSISQITVGFPTVGGGPYAGSIVAENHLADHSGSRLVPGPPPLHCPTFPDEFLAEARRLFRARTAASQLRQRAPGLAPSRIPRPLQRGRRGSSRSSSQFHPPVAATLGRRSVHSRRRTRPGPQAGLFPPWTGPSSPRSPVTSSPAPAAP